MVSSCSGAANEASIAYIVSCLVHELQHLRETLEFYELNYTSSDGEHIQEPELTPLPGVANEEQVANEEHEEQGLELMPSHAAGPLSLLGLA